VSASVLLLGGTGPLGRAAAERAVACGFGVTVGSRSEPVGLPADARWASVDADRPDSLREVVTRRSIGVVVNFVGYAPDQVAGHIAALTGIVGQYLFISTCSVFARPVPLLPVTESSPRGQRNFPYARLKLECELLLEAAFRETGFPATIARPYQTYSESRPPFLAGWTAIHRMRQGSPVIVHGDGASVWTLMHARDFARVLVPLFGNPHAIGESVNLVSSEALTWDQIHLAMAAAAGISSPQLIHRSSEDIAQELPEWSAVLREDFRHSMVFDATKLTRLVPGFAPSVTFSTGAREIIAYQDAHPEACTLDERLSAAFDRLATRRDLAAS